MRYYLEIGKNDSKSLNDRFKDRKSWSGILVESYEQIDNALTSFPEIDLLKINVGWCGKKIIYSVLERIIPTHIVFNTQMMSKEDFKNIDICLVCLGFKFRGREGNNVQYSQPSVLFIADERWSTGSIVKDLKIVSKWKVDIVDWSAYPEDLDKTVKEYDSVVSFLLTTPHAWRVLKDYAVICCQDVVEIGALKQKGLSIVGKHLGAISNVVRDTLMEYQRKGEIHLIQGSARINRFTKRSAREIKTLGWCGIPKGSNQGIKRYWMFEEIVKKTGMDFLIPGLDDYSYVNMQEYYDKIDLLICTSTSEGGPLPVFEAIACGVPVISTDVGMVKEMGTVWKFETSEQAAELVEKLKCPETLRKYVSDQYEEFSERFTMEGMAGEWDKFFSVCADNETTFLN